MRISAWGVVLVGLLSSLGCECGVKGEPTPPPDAGVDGGPVVLPDGGVLPPAEQALLGCDPALATEAELVAALDTELAHVRAQRAEVRAALLGDAVVSWAPGHDSATFTSLDREHTVDFLPTSANARSLGTALELDGTRALAFGASPFDTVMNEPPVNDALQAVTVRALSWLTRRDVTQAPLKVVVAHLPEVQYFHHERATRAWFAKYLPQATLNSGRCESQLLAGCLADADLLIISMESGDDNASAPPFDGPAALSAVAEARQRGVPVLYAHYYRAPNEFGAQVLAQLHLEGHTNYWAKEAVASLSATSGFPGGGPDLTAMQQVVEVVARTPVSADAYASCVGKKGTLFDCAAPGWKAQFATSLEWLRDELTLDQEAGRPLCPSTQRLFPWLVLLADKFRAGDAQTAALQYPVDAGDVRSFGRAAYADSVAPLLRPLAPAQVDLGTFTCTQTARLNGTCTGIGYDLAAVPRVDRTLRATVTVSDDWTSTGGYALPGVPFTLTRSAAHPEIKTRAVLNFQRVGTTMPFKNYARPQWLKSASVPLEVGVPVTLSSPWGGPIYLFTTPVDASSTGVTVEVEAKNVGEHACLLDAHDSASVADYPRRLRENPLPHTDVKLPGLELHVRKDRLDTLSRDYRDDAAAMVDDLRHVFLEQGYRLAGFKVPEMPLTQTLSADVQLVCGHLGWNCLDETLHDRQVIQHVNYDGISTCGNGCSGNPIDIDWSVEPLGWGESHELGHNLQRRKLAVGWFPNGKVTDYAAYLPRATENSNNIFPYHAQWFAWRVRTPDALPHPTGVDHKDLFAVLQSDAAGLTRMVNGQSRKVVFNAKCERLGDFDPGSSRNAGAAVWALDDTPMTNRLRLTFLLDLAFQSDGQALSDGTVLHDGFDVLTLLYLQGRLFDLAADSETTWLAQRDALGFGLFPWQMGPVFPAGKVRDVPANDYVVVAMSYLSGKDYRPYFTSRGVPFSTLADAQVAAHVASGRVMGVVDTRLFVRGDELFPSPLSAGLQRVAIDGVSSWPLDGWHPSQCP